MNQRKTKALQKRVHKHAKQSCANYEGEGSCKISNHGKCLLAFESGRVCGNVCPHYMKAVGPGESALFDEYLEQFPSGYPLKPSKTEFPDRCAKCHQRYKRTSNRQKYCERCKDEVKRKQAADRMKRKRRTDAMKGVSVTH